MPSNPMFRLLAGIVIGLALYPIPAVAQSSLPFDIGQHVLHTDECDVDGMDGVEIGSIESSLISPPSFSQHSAGDQHLGTFSAFVGLDGSKQPQDFGVNASLGGQARFSYAAPLVKAAGIGFQIGTSITAYDNAVPVFGIVGEETERFQSMTTVGVFKRSDNGLFAGAVYDYAAFDSYDRFQLSQWRLRAGYELSPTMEVGTTFNLRGQQDDADFNGTIFSLRPIEQLSIYGRKLWGTGVQSTAFFGVSEGHGESNLLTGIEPRKNNQFLFGADFLAPLTTRLAMYGEATLMMPADTGSVDAFLGFEYVPRGVGRKTLRNRYREMLPVATSATLTTDLLIP